MPIRWKLFVSLVGPALIVAGLALVFGFDWLREFGRAEIRTALLARTVEQANRIDDRLIDLRRVAEKTAQGLASSATLTEVELSDWLRRNVELDPGVGGNAVVYKPYRYQPDRERFAPYVARVGSEVIELGYDHLVAHWPGQSWHQNLNSIDALTWFEPARRRDSTGNLSALVVSPFGQDPDNYDGIVVLELPIGEFGDESDGVSDFGASRLIVSAQERVIWDQSQRYEVGSKLVDAPGGGVSADERRLVDAITRASNGVVEMGTTDSATGHWALFARVQSTGWTLVRWVPISRAMAFPRSQLQRAAWVVAVVIVALLALTFVVASYLTGPARKLAAAAGQLGAGDFSTRVTDVNSADELGDLARAFNNMVSELDLRVKELTQATAAKEAVEGELRAARRIQASLLPSTFPAFPERNEFELHGVNAPAAHVGGDFYDFFFRNDDELVLAIADVSGKGVPAALLMAVTRTIVHNLASQGLEPAAIVSETNRLLLADNVGSMYVTLFVAVYDIHTGIFRYANGAHLAPLVVSGDGQVSEVGEATGTLVGILEDTQFTQAEHRLAVGDLLVLYTDGVPEARAPDGRFFGDAPLKHLLGVHAGEPAEFLCELVAREVDAHQNGERTDDMTLLMLRRKR